MDAENNALAVRQAAICHVFAHFRRVLILWTLIEHEKSVGEISTDVDASLQSTSQHLRLMKKRGILDSRREAQKIYYRISDDQSLELSQLLIQVHKKMNVSKVTV